MSGDDREIFNDTSENGQSNEMSDYLLTHFSAAAEVVPFTGLNFSFGSILDDGPLITETPKNSFLFKICFDFKLKISYVSSAAIMVIRRLAPKS